jgi:hypothetical protein
MHHVTPQNTFGSSAPKIEESPVHTVLIIYMQHISQVLVMNTSEVFMSKSETTSVCSAVRPHLRASGRALEAYVRDIHDKIKNVKCELCDFASGNWQSLRKHVKSGLCKDQRPTLCDYCTGVQGNLRFFAPTPVPTPNLFPE